MPQDPVKPKTIKERLAEIHAEAKPKKVTPVKKVEEQPTQTLAQRLGIISAKSFISDKEKKLTDENSMLKRQISTAKSKRGPSLSSRISGLGKLQSFK